MQCLTNLKMVKLFYVVEFGKATKKYFYEKGKVIEKDYYFKDYCVLVGNGIEEWFNERDLIKINK